jgi:hypothetical protein
MMACFELHGGSVERFLQTADGESKSDANQEEK